MRHQGALLRWDADRGFGFIAPEPRGDALFVHVTAFAQGDKRPDVGEAVTYEVARVDGRLRAVHVVRAAIEVEPPRAWGPALLGRRQMARAARPADASAPAAAPRGRRQPARPRNSLADRLWHAPLTPRRAHPVMRTIAIAVALLACGLKLAESLPQYLDSLRPARTHAPAPTDMAAESPAFQCDGRTMCSQMHSCAEATYFLQHCPNTRMDGDGDGIPCEQQWCH